MVITMKGKWKVSVVSRYANRQLDRQASGRIDNHTDKQID